jgi:hypothetical protein
MSPLTPSGKLQFFDRTLRYNSEIVISKLVNGISTLTIFPILSKFLVGDRHALHILGEYGLSFGLEIEALLGVLAMIFGKIQNFGKMQTKFVLTADRTVEPGIFVHSKREIQPSRYYSTNFSREIRIFLPG